MDIINKHLPRVSSLGMSRHSVTCPISVFPTRMEKGIWQMGQKSLSVAPSPEGSGDCGQRECNAAAATWSLWPWLITDTSPLLILPVLFTDVWGICPLLILPVLFTDVWGTCPLLILPSELAWEQLFFLEVFLEWLVDAVFFFFLRGLYSQMSSSLLSVWDMLGFGGYWVVVKALRALR